jgi:DNA-binding NarL/FixJ family response regulator
MVDILSQREREVLALIGSGKGVTEIARMLGLSVKTASVYRTRAVQKLMAIGAIANNSTAALVRYAILNEQRGVLDLTGQEPLPPNHPHRGGGL